MQKRKYEDRNNKKILFQVFPFIRIRVDVFILKQIRVSDGQKIFLQPLQSASNSAAIELKLTSMTLKKRISGQHEISILFVSFGSHCRPLLRTKKKFPLQRRSFRSSFAFFILPFSVFELVSAPNNPKLCFTVCSYIAENPNYSQHCGHNQSIRNRQCFYEPRFLQQLIRRGIDLFFMWQFDPFGKVDATNAHNV